ncbi:hypothetical protein EON73_00210 [bacterium]|nr:MAG: hypothetical protein EON73_00210 [bacterium]
MSVLIKLTKVRKGVQSSCKSVQKHKRVLPSFQKPRIGVQSLNKSFGLQNFVQNFVQNFSPQAFASHTKRSFVRRLQALQSKALFKFLDTSCMYTFVFA